VNAPVIIIRHSLSHVHDGFDSIGSVADAVTPKHLKPFRFVTTNSLFGCYGILLSMLYVYAGSRGVPTGGKRPGECLP